MRPLASSISATSVKVPPISTPMRQAMLVGLPWVGGTLARRRPVSQCDRVAGAVAASGHAACGEIGRTALVMALPAVRRDLQVIACLQVQPQFRRLACEPQGAIGGDAPPGMDDVVASGNPLDSLELLD